MLAVFKGAESPRDRVARLAQLLLARAHLVEPLRQLTNRTAQRIGVHAQRLEAAAQLEETRDVVLERERLLEHAAQLVDLAAQQLGALRVLSELRLGTPL